MSAVVGQKGDKTKHARARLQSESLLIVDDDPNIIALLGEMLAGLECDYVCVTSGQEALQAIRANQNFTYVMLDVSLPDYDGRTIAVEVASRLPNTRIIMMSSRVDITQVVDFPFLQKPFSFKEFMSIFS